MTINVDGQGAIGIRKANDAGALVVLEANDIKHNVPTTLVRDTVNNFFVYAPRGGNGGLWMNDWNSYNTVYDISGSVLSVNSVSYRTFLDITGEGFLTYLRADSAFSSSRNPNYRITVDGVAYVFEGVDSGAASQGNELLQNIYFKTSLKIEIYNRTASATNMYCDYCYLLKNGNPSSNKQQILLSSNRKMSYAENATITNADVANITGSGYIIGIQFGEYYSSAGSFTRSTITVDGVVKMNDRIVCATDDRQQNSLFKFPIKFNSNFRIQQRTSSVGSVSYCRVWYVLD
jgi:hypothetical protein